MTQIPDFSNFVLEAESKSSFGRIKLGRIKPGNYSAICSHVIDLGTQVISGVDKDTKKEYSYEARKVFINFALTAEKISINNEVIEKAECFIGRSFSLSFGPNSGLFKTINSWMGEIPAEQRKKFNVYSLIGKPCMVGVGVKEVKKEVEVNGVKETKINKYQQFLTVGQLPEGMPPYQHKVELGASMFTPNGELYKDEYKEYLSPFDKRDLENSKEFALLFGITPIEEQEAEIKKEIENNQKQEPQEVEELGVEHVNNIFDGTAPVTEPKGQTEAREKAKNAFAD